MDFSRMSRSSFRAHYAVSSPVTNSQNNGSHSSLRVRDALAVHPHLGARAPADDVEEVAQHAGAAGVEGGLVPRHPILHPLGVQRRTAAPAPPRAHGRGRRRRRSRPRSGTDAGGGPDRGCPPSRRPGARCPLPRGARRAGADRRTSSRAPGSRREDRARSFKGQRCYSDAMTAPSMPGGDARRRLPSIDQVLQSPAGARPRGALRPVPGDRPRRACWWRRRGRRRRGATLPAWMRWPTSRPAWPGGCESAFAPSLVRVINATGVVVHTNLGRAPLPAAVALRVAEVASGYSNLELDLRRRRARRARGPRRGAAARAAGRGSDGRGQQQRGRGAAGRQHLRRGARGGGEPRRAGGDRRLLPHPRGAAQERAPRCARWGRPTAPGSRTIARALGPATGMILKVHPSNFRIVGFAEAATREELAAVAAEAKVPLVEDLGSGLIAPLPPPLDREEMRGREPPRRRGRGHVQRRQAAGRTAGGRGGGQGRPAARDAQPTRSTARSASTR